MQDPNWRDFQGRVGRIVRTHERGAGFEAAGTLGMSHYTQQRTRRRRLTWAMPVALVLMTVVGIKAAVLTSIGDDAYGERIAALNAGGTADRIGAYILQADPLTRWAAGVIGNAAP
jgi:hypothetical protein